MKRNGGIKLPSLQKLEELGKQERVHENTTPASQEDQVHELIRTVKCHLAPSPVHGVGVFALRDIKKGELACCALNTRPQWYQISMATLSKFLDKTYPEIKEMVISRWPHVVNGAQFISPNYDARLVSFMNHSDEPNYDPATDKALKDIKKGEELFENYKTVYNWDKAFPWLVK